MYSKLKDKINVGATMEQISLAATQLGITFPEDYIEFMIYSNGYRGFIDEAYIVIWQVEELVKMNKDYEVDEYMPNLVLFGSNGADEALAFEKNNNMHYVLSPFIGTGEDLLLEDESLEGFMDRISKW